MAQQGNAMMMMQSGSATPAGYVPPQQLGYLPIATPGGATPAMAVEAPQGPSGLTPNAKRPRDPATIAVAAGGAQDMSTAELSQAFTNVCGKQDAAEQFALNVAGCVQYNGDLLNSLITRVNTIEAAATFVASDVGEIKGTVEKLTEDTRAALQKVEAQDVATDALLRQQAEVRASCRFTAMVLVICFVLNRASLYFSHYFGF